jgi:23S rRNA (cytosine1962-C5)-methyltransferase
MDKLNQVTLKPGKEKAVLKKHPWIFSGAIDSLPAIEPGEILSIFSHTGTFLAQGYFHPSNSLAGRILTFTDAPIEQVLREKFQRALELRKTFIDHTVTDCYRLIHAEGDGIPGLIVDLYGSVAVIQINTWGIERLRPLIQQTLIDLLKPQAIYEKSTSSARKMEGLSDTQGFLYGSCEDQIAVKENGIRFWISLEKGQKTGFFLDQREMRRTVGALSSGKKVLNCFSYSGGFSLYALKGSASHVISVDASEEALRLAALNTELNGFDTSQHEMIQADVFEFLRTSSFDSDFIILDPPAFAKKKGDVIAACSGYKEINRLAMQRMAPRSLLLTCSCSHFISEALFQNIVFQAAMEAGREVQILARHQLALDHPINLAHPEGEYLKSLLLHIVG